MFQLPIFCNLNACSIEYMYDVNVILLSNFQSSFRFDGLIWLGKMLFMLNDLLVLKIASYKA